METPRIYVGTYKKYNEGSLFGKWLDLSDYTSRSEFYDACLELHSDEEDPELMFQDWEYIPRAMISECSVSDEVWELLELDEDQQEAAKAYIDWRGSWSASDFEDSYVGEYDSALDFTYEFVDDVGYLKEMPESLQGYFDYEAFSRDLFMTDYHFDNGFVFRET